LTLSFVSILLHSRYYQRAFRAITTGHSNRRRTQQGDFEALEIAFPASRREQKRLIKPILDAIGRKTTAGEQLLAASREFNRLVDSRENTEVPPDLEDDDDIGEQSS
jgi:type I restriction enzyme M protein